jgi:predicted RNA-binding protein with TRAM domain
MEVTMNTSTSWESRCRGRWVRGATAGAMAALVVACGGGGYGGGGSSMAPNSSAPMITSQPADVSVTAGNTATFTVAATGSGTLTYQWMRFGNMVPGATSASYTTPATTMANNGDQYSVTVTNTVSNGYGSSAGTATSRTAILTVM